jgi:hypothetical protein
VISLPPWLRIIEAAVAALDVPDLLVLTEEPRVNVRHHRHRGAAYEELPDLAVRFEEDEEIRDSLEGNSMLSMWEVQRQLTLSLVCETEIATEVSDLDPTGLARPARILAAAKELLRREDGALDLKSDRVIDGPVVLNEQSTPDHVRLVCEIIVLYRVRSDDPNVLLAKGENG